MQLSLLFTIISSIALARCFVLPPNIKEGVYLVTGSTSNASSFTFERANDIVALNKEEDSLQDPSSVTQNSTAITPQKRDYGRVYCGCGVNLNHADTDATVQSIKNYLKTNPIKAHQYVVAVQGNVAAFLCNGNQVETFKDNGNEFANMAQTITNACGLYVAGTQNLKNLYYYGGYMGWYQGRDVCTDSRSSPKQSC